MPDDFRYCGLLFLRAVLIPDYVGHSVSFYIAPLTIIFGCPVIGSTRRKSRHGQGKPEAAALADFAMQQDVTVQPLHNFFYYGQPETTAFYFMFSQPDKRLKELLLFGT